MRERTGAEKGLGVRYEGVIGRPPPERDGWPMKKRILAGALWFYALWYLGVTLAFHFGTPQILGPIVGLALGMLVAVDPGNRFWRRPSRAIQNGPRPARIEGASVAR